MDYKNYYEQDPAFDTYDGEPSEKRSGAFTVVVLVLVGLILAALIVGLVIRTQRGDDLVWGTPVPEATATPAPDATQRPAADDPQNPLPTVTPFLPPTYDMPELDGAMPDIPFGIDNPIPDVYDAVSESVVGVLNYTEAQIGEALILDVYGSGTGFIVSSDGFVLTNAHVVADAAKVTVLLPVGGEVDAVVVGSDEETDVAVLKIDRKGLKAIACGDSDAVRVGEFVLAIGNPLDSEQLANTVTFGIISANKREITIDTYTNTYLQTDAAINFGNSGGPLLNLRGEVIGMNSAKTITAGYDEYGNAVAAEGIGFALPINQVVRIMEQLITYGTIERPGIGIMVGTITKAQSEAMGVPLGASVESVVRGGPAAKAGLRKGDIIVEANGESIQDQQSLIAEVQKLLIGDTLRVRVYREGAYLDLAILIENKTSMNFDEMDE